MKCSCVLPMLLICSLCYRYNTPYTVYIYIKHPAKIKIILLSGIGSINEHFIYTIYTIVYRYYIKYDLYLRMHVASVVADIPHLSCTLYKHLTVLISDSVVSF